MEILSLFDFSTNQKSVTINFLSQIQIFYKFATNLRSIQTFDRIFGIAGIFKFNKRKARWVSGNPNISQGPVFAERGFDLVLARTAAEISDPNFAGKIPLTVTRHCVFCNCVEGQFIY